MRLIAGTLADANRRVFAWRHMAPLRGANYIRYILGLYPYIRCVLKLIKRRGVVVFLEGVNEQ